MALQLTLKTPPSIPLELEGLTPDWACGKSLADIERFEVFQGNQKLPLAEFFSVSGSLFDETMVMSGDLSKVHWIGAHLKRGTIRIEGSAGRHVGSQMRGGELMVEGNVEDWAGAEMRAGLLRIRGDARDQVGAAYRGSQKGMTGGTLLVHGNAGVECGAFMRRGFISIGGLCGAMPGYQMIAGTIAVWGDCGIRPGAGMKRGTLMLLGRNRPALLPSFRYSATLPLQSHRLLLVQLQSLNFPVPVSSLPQSLEMYRGDLVSLGLGEVLFPA